MLRTNRSIAALATVAAVAATGVASAATGPYVSAQHDLHGTAPLTIPGTGVKQGDWMGKKVLVIKSVRVARGQSASLTLTAPKGFAIRGLAVDGKIGFVAQRGYAGERTVTVKTFAAGKDAGPHRGKVYALAQ